MNSAWDVFKMLKFVFFGCVALFVVCHCQNRKPGICPPRTNIGVCDLTCFRHDHCPGIEKCCETSCGGMVCTRPVTSRNPKYYRDKPGNCPKTPTGPWVCTSRCALDGDCRRDYKCCTNRCGALACTKPEQ